MSDGTANNQGRVGSETARELYEQKLGAEMAIAWVTACLNGKLPFGNFWVSEEILQQLRDASAQHDAQLVADLTASNLSLQGVVNRTEKLLAEACEREERERALAVGAALEAAAINGCYCICHSMSSSRPACVHCHPEYFADKAKADPYCGLTASGVEKIRASIPEASKKALADEREQEEREKALAVGAALEGAIAKVNKVRVMDAKAGITCKTYFAKEIEDEIRASIPEASKKALAAYELRAAIARYKEG